MGADIRKDLQEMKFQLADVYDALISKRCYKPSFSYDTAYQMILDGECGIFNPRLLQCFIKKKNELEAMAEQFKD